MLSIALKMKKVIFIALMLILPSLTGCIKISQVKKLEEIITPPQKYKWIKKVDEKADFGLFDMINAEIAKVDYYPFMVENGTKFLHIYIHVNFSKPFGKLNFTIVSPEKNLTKEYSTIAKSYKYDDFLYFNSPKPGNWKIIVKVTGIGKYSLVAETYQKI